MKHIKHIKQLLTILSLAPVMCAAQTSTENYVKTMTMLDKNNQRSMSSVQYYNGLGYPTVSAGVVGGSGQTAYSLTTYDALGREEKKYLPVSVDQSIAYKAPATIISSSNTSYGDGTAYSQNHFDALDRITSVELPGKAWRDADKRNATEYSANTASDNVIRYGVSNDKLTQDSYYPAKSLTKETSKDADNKTVITFKDLFGNTILQRTLNGSSKYDTYYVYDRLGLLRFVLPPKCTSADKVASMGYRYRYDWRGRLITKDLPGCDSITYVYDNADRMIRMRDPRLRSAGKYRFFIYDKFGRMVIQGVCKSCPTGSTVRNAEFSSGEEGVLGTGYVMPKEYTDALKEAQLEIANYYDGSQKNLKSSAAAYTYFAGIQMSTVNDAQRGQLTASVSTTTNGKYIAQTMLYDIKGNLLKTQCKDIEGRLMSVNNTYSFTNKVLTSSTNVNVYGGSFTAKETYGYNEKIDKKKSYSLTLNHGTAATASLSYAYDNLGRLSTVTRPVNRSITYAYDMRGWLTGITTHSFIEEIFYADGPGTKYYNGNISSIKWKDNTTGIKRGYKYSYDGANRMTSGVYGEGEELTSNTNRYNESMSYDANGNILTVKRYGRLSSGKYGLMDDLSISYSGNQPTSVSEAAADYNFTGSFEYKKAKGSGYKFNNSGSLLADKSRGIAYITYDLNNNPEKIYFTNGNMTKYVYSASGQKLRAVHYTAKPNITKAWGSKPADLTAAQTLSADSTDYVLGGSLVMKNGRIDKFMFEGGYAQAKADGSYKDNFTYYFYNKDHLGNNREVIATSGVVQQVTTYYPFGAPYADAAGGKYPDLQPYKYNGKELDRMHGLNTYDYGARQHDPILARWDRIDPLCEKYYNVSPYNYCLNNPVKNIDPDGKVVAQIVGGLIGAGVELASQVTDNLVDGKSAFDNISIGKIGIAAAEGAVTCGGSAVRKAFVKVGASAVASIGKAVIDASNGKNFATSLSKEFVSSTAGKTMGKVVGAVKIGKLSSTAAKISAKMQPSSTNKVKKMLQSTIGVSSKTARKYAKKIINAQKQITRCITDEVKNAHATGAEYVTSFSSDRQMRKMGEY